MSAQSLNHEAARLDALYQCHVLDTASEGAFDDIVRLASRLCGAPVAFIGLMDRDRQWFKSALGLPASEIPRRDAVLCAEALARRDLVVVRDALADRRFAGSALVTGPPHVRFYAGVPLLTPDGVALGTLGVVDRAPRELSHEQADALRLLARQVVAQLEQRRLEAELVRTKRERERAEEALVERARLDALRADVRGALIEGNTMRGVLQRCAEALARHMDAALACIWMLDEATQMLVLRASAGLSAHVDGRHGRVPVGLLEIRRLALERQPYLTNAVCDDPRIGDPEWARREGLVGFASHPLIVAGRLLGVVAMFARRPLPPAALNALAAVVDSIGLSLQRGQAETERLELLAREQAARAESETAQRRFAFLAEASSRLAASLDYETTLTSLARLAVPELADWCFVDLLERGRGTRRLAMAHAEPVGEALARELREISVDLAGPHPISRALRTGRPELVAEITDEWLATMAHDPEYVRRIRALGLRSSIVVPLVARGQMLGAMTFATAGSGRRYGAGDLALVQELARRASLAVDNARLYREVQDSRQRFYDLVQGLDAIVWEADVESGRFTFVSQRAEAILGYPIERWLDEPDFWANRIVHPDDREWAVSFTRAELAAGRDHEFEYRAVTADGRVLWLRDFIRVGLDGQGRARHLRGVKVNITERKRAEEALRSRARQQAAVADLGQRALGGVGLGRLMDEAVRLVADTLEVEYAEVLERQPDDVLLVRAGVGWNGARAAEAAVSAGRGSLAGYTLLSDGPVIVESWDAETRFGGRALSARGIVSSMSVVIQGHGGPFGVLAAHTTRRRTFTADDGNFLQAIANVLATAIQRRRTEEALRESEEQLRQAQKMEAVGRLAGGIAHDFNNLLTAIVGHSELLLGDLDGQSALCNELDEIRKAAERAASLTRQLLAFSRRQVLQPRVLDLNAVVADMEKMLRRLIGEDIELRTALGAGLGRVKADPGQLEQVLMNLAVNARDAMPRGGTLTIETADVELDNGYARRHVGVRPGPYVRLAVTDTGCGMDAEIRARVFEPFFTTKGPGRGTGLGLATVYGIVKQSGGNIWVYSEPGRGSTFKVYLPRVDEPLEAQPPGAPGRSSAGTETILLVEDDESVRGLACRILAREGYTVLEARDGNEALAIGERHGGPIHLVLTDLVIPGKQGTEVASCLASLRPDTKVLYMSGYTERALFQQQVFDPGTPFIEKPFTPAALARKVREVLDGPGES